jgi:hypothetical protein
MFALTMRLLAPSDSPGTPAGFYFQPAADAASASKWQLYFQGGGAF